MTVRFFHVGQEIFINNYIPEVLEFLFGQISDLRKKQLAPKIIANKEGRDFLFRIYMGNIVNENGEQFCSTNCRQVFNRSWTFVYLFIKHQCMKSSVSKSVEKIVLTSIGTTSDNNRENLEKQHRAMENQSNGSLAYIKLSIQNAKKRVYKQEKKQSTLDKKDGRREIHIDPTNPDVNHFEDTDIIEVAQDYIHGLSHDGLLLPDPNHPKTMFLDWFVDLDNLIFSDSWLATKFTAKNQMDTIQRLTLFRQAVRQNDYTYIQHIMDQCRRCKRKLVGKLLKDIFVDLQMLEDIYDSTLLRSAFQVIMPEVFEIPDDAQKKWEQRGNAATMLKTRFDYMTSIHEIYLPRLNQLVNHKVDLEHFVIECRVMRLFIMMLIIIHTLQKRTAKHRNNSTASQ